MSNIKHKILIVEDDAVIAQLIEMHLWEFGHHVIDIVHDSEQALDKIHNLRPDLVLLDINILGSRDGIEVAEIMQHHYDIPYIFLTALSDKRTLERAQKLTPMGYIVKPFKERDLEVTVAIGMSNYLKQKNNESITLDSINMNAVSPLSEREFDILLLVVRGFTNQQIARDLDLSINTVKWHTQNIFSKLGVKNRTAAAQVILKL